MAVLSFVYAFLMGTTISFELRTSSPATILYSVAAWRGRKSSA
jgi:hypothetical protein